MLELKPGDKFWFYGRGYVVSELMESDWRVCYDLETGRKQAFTLHVGTGIIPCDCKIKAGKFEMCKGKDLKPGDSTGLEGVGLQVEDGWIHLDTGRHREQCINPERKTYKAEATCHLTPK